MWATAHLIESVGCDNVHIDCGATDVAYVMGKYKDAGTDLTPAKECLKKKCPTLEVPAAVLVEQGWAEQGDAVAEPFPRSAAALP